MCIQISSGQVRVTSHLTGGVRVPEPHGLHGGQPREGQEVGNGVQPDLRVEQHIKSSRPDLLGDVVQVLAAHHLVVTGQGQQSALHLVELPAHTDEKGHQRSAKNDLGEGPHTCWKGRRR